MDRPTRILFMGTSDFAVPALRALREAGYPVPLVITQPDRPAGRGLELRGSPVKKAALELGLEVFQPDRVKEPAAVERLRGTGAEVAVIAAYGQILPPEVLAVPSVACLNIHGSLLPKYRGAAPVHYAVMSGETETGVTIMYVAEKMDAGDVLLAKRTPIGPAETTGEVHDRLASLGADGLLEALGLLSSGRAPRVPQDPSLATYAPSLKREQCVIRWDRDARNVVDLVRGLSPWPVAETRWGGTVLRVHSARMGSGDPGGPGEILGVTKEGIVVGAGNGTVLLTELQPPGKKRMSAFDLTLGHPDLRKGGRFS